MKKDARLTTPWIPSTLLSLLCGLLFVSTSGAQVSLSLETCIHIAMTHNKDILQARQTVSEAEGKVASDEAEYFPQVTLDGSYANQEDVSEGRQPDKEALSTDLKVSQQILRFGQTPPSTFNVRRALRKAQFDYEKTRINVFYDVRKAFFSYLLTQDEIQQRGELLREYQMKYERAKERLQAGKVIPVEVMEAELEVLDEQLRISNLKRTLRTQKIDLLRKIGILEHIVPTQVVIVGQITHLGEAEMAPEDSLRAMVAEAFDRRVDIAELKGDIEEQRRKVEEVAWEWFPDLSATASYKYGRTSVGLDLKGDKRTWRTGLSAMIPLYRHDLPALEDDGDWRIEVGMHFPIFEGFRSWGVLKQEQAKLQHLLYELEKKRNAVELEVTTRFYELQEAKERLDIQRRRVQVKRERLKVVEAKIEKGTGSNLTYDDVLRQRQDVTTTQKQYFTERLNYVMAGEDLQKAIGRIEIPAVVERKTDLEEFGP